MHNTESAPPSTQRARRVLSLLVWLAGTPLLLAQTPTVPAAGVPARVSAGTLDRIRETHRVRFGYRTDARPFSYRDDSGRPAGYSIALCQHIGQGLKADLLLETLAVDWVPVSIDERFRAVQDQR